MDRNTIFVRIQTWKDQLLGEDFLLAHPSETFFFFLKHDDI